MSETLDIPTVVVEDAPKCLDRSSFVAEFFKVYFKTSFRPSSEYVDRWDLFDQYEKLVEALKEVDPQMSLLSFRNHPKLDAGLSDEEKAEIVKKWTRGDRQSFMQSIAAPFRSSLDGPSDVISTLKAFKRSRSDILIGLVQRTSREVDADERLLTCQRLRVTFNLSVSVESIAQNWPTHMTCRTETRTISIPGVSSKFDAQSIKPEEVTPGKRKLADAFYDARSPVVSRTPVIARTAEPARELQMVPDSLVPKVDPPTIRQQEHLKASLDRVLAKLDTIDKRLIGQKQDGLQLVQNDLFMVFGCPICRCFDWVINPYNQSTGVKRCKTCKCYMHSDCVEQLGLAHDKGTYCPCCLVANKQNKCSQMMCTVPFVGTKKQSSLQCQMCKSWFCAKHINSTVLKICKNPDKKDPLKVPLCKNCKMRRTRVDPDHEN